MNIEDFIKSNCKLLNSSPELFRFIFAKTNQDPCSTGCAWFKDGKCADYLRIRSFPTIKNNPVYTESNAQMAERLGITKRQASKLRRTENP